MEKLVFDSGIKEYQVTENGILRFNPSDPNVYARFVEATGKIQAVETGLTEKAQSIQVGGSADGEAVLDLLREADREVKNILSWVFGENNNFDKILGGVNLLAVGENGDRIITNFINALIPIIEDGAKKCAGEQVDAAVAVAKQNREQRRAKR